MREEVKVMDMYSLSPMQEGMLFHYLLDRQSLGYFEQMSYCVNGDINKVVFEQAFNQLIERHDVLRTVFVYKKTAKPRQVLFAHRKTSIHFEDISHLPEEKRKDYIKDFKQRDKERGFDLSKDILIRLSLIKTSEFNFEIILSFHHIIMDGWCTAILIKEMLEIYHCLEKGEIVNLPAVPSYKTYIRWLENQDREQALQFWGSYLEDYENQIFVTPAIKEKQKKFQLRERLFNFPESITTSLNEISKKRNITLNTLFLGLWGVLLQKYNNTEDVVFGSVVSGRPAELPGIEQMVGLFINTLPVRIRSEVGEKFSSLLERVQIHVFQSKSFEFIALADIQARSILKGDLLNHILIFENYPVEAETKKINQDAQVGFSIEDIDVFEQTNYDLNVFISPGKELTIKIQYNCILYDDVLINSIESHLKCMVEQLIKDIHISLEDIEIISEQEREQLLIEFNNTSTQFSKGKAIHDLVEGASQQTPHCVSVIGDELLIGDEGSEDQIKPYRVHITCQKLTERSDGLARLLRKKGVHTDTPIGIMMDRSIELMVGLLGILKSGGAYLPIDPQFPKERVNYMLADSGTEWVITSQSLAENIKEMNQDSCTQMDPIFIDALDLDISAPDHFFFSNPKSIAYSIYTSGTTGKPKGIMVEHTALVNFIEGIARKMNFDSNDALLSLTTISFDIFGLEAYLPLSQGFKFLLGNQHQQMNPGEVAKIMINENVTCLQVTPSRLQMLVEDHTNNHCLKQLKFLLVGGEIFPGPLLEKVKSMTPARIFNMYGPTETTIWSTVKEVNGDFQLNIGKPIANTSIYILGIYNNLQPIGILGELCIGGMGLARGYTNHPELTQVKFEHVNKKFLRGSRGRFLQKATPGYCEKIIYRTGDLACWLPDGNIDFFGRLDHQVKVRGFRIELHEIENTLRKHENINEALLVVKQDGNGNNYLSAYYTSAKEIDIMELREFISEELPEYMIPTSFKRLDEMPLTPNGKLDRKKLLEDSDHLGDVGEDYVAPKNEREEIIASIWEDLFHREKIGVTDNFFQLGGHSLIAISIIARINNQLGSQLPISIIFEKPTIVGLVEELLSEHKNKGFSVEKCPFKDYYYLSHSQKRLWFFNQMEPENAAYNISQALRLSGDFNIDVLEKSIELLIKKHESLRTSIGIAEEVGEDNTMEEVPVQRVSDEVDFKVEMKDISTFETEDKEKSLSRFILEVGTKPFDLSKAPLFRVALLKMGEQEYVMVFVMHHIISDAWSLRVMTKDFVNFYDSIKTKSVADFIPLKFQYKDFAQSQNHWLTQEGLKKQQGYWHQKLAPELPVLDLFTDYPRPHLQSSRGDKVVFILDQDLTKQLRALARRNVSTVFMILVAAVKILLYRYTRQEDIIIGTLVSGRTVHELEEIVGYFVNILAIRDNIHGEMSFENFLKDVRKTILDAFDNQDYPFDRLVDELKVDRNPGRSPVFDIMMVFQNEENLLLDSVLDSLKIEGLERDYVVSKYDLYLDIIDMSGQIKVIFEFCTDLYKKETIHRMSEHLINILQAISKVDSPAPTLSKLNILSEREKTCLLVDFNNTQKDIPEDQCFQQLFQQQVGRNPSAIAAKHNVKDISYEKLNEKSNQISVYLEKHGVGPNTMVLLYLGRGIDMLASILGVFKAGAAYLPVEVEYPDERILYILKDADVPLMITNSESDKRSLVTEIRKDNQRDINIFNLDDSRQLEGFPIDNPSCPVNPDHYAYMIYTSGTTGQPKGVVIHQRGMINHLYAKINDLSISENDRIAQTASPCFDISVWQFLSALLTGGRTVIFDYEVVLNPEEMLSGLQEEKITIFESVPSLMTVFLEMLSINENKKLEHLRWMIPTGEALKPELVKQWFKHYPEIKLVNAYGPTEASDDITHYIIENREDIGELTVPIGKPIQNMRIYILDQYLSLCPIGVQGEICVAGIGVGKGYWKDPQKTKQAFIANPYGRGIVNQDYAMLYRTGDIGYFRPDGNIECLGRIDNQVKIRGFRVELEEIETVILKYPTIVDCAVVLKNKDSGNPSLVAFWLEKSPTDIDEVKKFIPKYLPAYMVPAAFVKLDQFPLSTAGKVDRKALMKMDVDIHVSGAETESTPPSTDTERQLAEIWSNSLKKSSIGIHDNFFDLGGHSLLIPRIFKEINTLFPGKCRILDLFEYMTIYELARHIDGIEPDAEEDEDVIIELSID